jgi:hypothetical protein
MDSKVGVKSGTLLRSTSSQKPVPRGRELDREPHVVYDIHERRDGEEHPELKVPLVFPSFSCHFGQTPIKGCLILL